MASIEKAMKEDMTRHNQKMQELGVSETAGCSAADAALIEGVTSFAAWLVDNAEGEAITEESLMEWGTKAIREMESKQ